MEAEPGIFQEGLGKLPKTVTISSVRVDIRTAHLSNTNSSCRYTDLLSSEVLSDCEDYCVLGRDAV
jgi:hypothetical protein